MSFFIRGSEKKNLKRKTTKNIKINGASRPPKSKKVNFKAEDDITSESDNESKIDDISPDISDGETADAKRNRLAKKMLEDIKDKYGDDEEEISMYLKQEILERKGKAFHEVAHEYEVPIFGDFINCKWSKLSVITSIIIHPNNAIFFSGSKDGSIIKWCLLTGKKLAIIHGNWKKNNPIGHSDEVLTLALTTDAKFLASGGRDTIIHIWDPSNLNHLGSLSGHKKSINGLSFRMGSHQLFSCSDDKSIKLWTVDEMAYIETLFGHEDGVLGIDSLSEERVVSCGGRDGTVRLWKIIDESHLIFHGHAGCIECVKYIDDRHFFSAADDNSLAIWTIDRKKPIATVKNAHSGINRSEPVNKVVDCDDYTEEAGLVAAVEKASNNEDAEIIDSTDFVDQNITSVASNHIDNLNSTKTTTTTDKLTNGCVELDQPSTLNRSIEKTVQSENWISAIAALRHSNLLASGSRDGLVKFWEIGSNFKNLNFLFSIQIEGFINALEFTVDGSSLLVGVGREHRLGRWFKTNKSIKNSICIIPLRKHDRTSDSTLNAMDI